MKNYVWEIIAGEDSKVFTDFYLLEQRERELRQEGVKFTTQMYVNNKRVAGFNERVGKGMISWREI